MSPFDVLVIYALRYLSFNNKQITSGSKQRDKFGCIGGHDTSRGLELVNKTGNGGTYSVALVKWTNILCLMHAALHVVMTTPEYRSETRCPRE